MQPVWVLSVDLQTKTATFQSGLSDAAKSARGAFTDIKSGAGEMGRATSGNMMEARHGVMLLGEEFGIHLPRALTSFIASIGPVGAAMEAAFPFLAIAVGATLLIEHLVKMQEAGEKLTQDQEKFGTAVNNAFNTLDNKLIQAQIRADELRNDHLGALKGTLELIDHASMDELVKSFETVAKAGDVVMKELEGHWYSFGRGSDGAKHALDAFQTQYDNLLSKGNAEAASGLLHGTADQAQKVLQALRDKEALEHNGSPDDTTYQKGIAAARVLQGIHVETGVTLTKQIEAQQNLVEILSAQLGSEERIAALKKLETGNAKTATGNAAAATVAAGQREAAESQLRMGQMVLTADRATAQSQLAIHRATIAERLQSDLDFAARDTQIKMAGNQAEIAALDKSGKDYANQLKALHDKALEITQQAVTTEAELKSKSAVELNAQELRDLEQGERAKIEGTLRASAARLAALDDAIRQEEDKNLQDTGFYRELLNQRIQAQQQMTEEAARLNEAAGKEEADNILRTGMEALAADRQAWALRDSFRVMTDGLRAQEERDAANAEYKAKTDALAKELSTLDKSGKDYANKLKANQNAEKLLIKQHADEIAAIKERAEAGSNARLLAGWRQFSDQMASGLTQSIMGHETWAKMLSGLGNQVVSSMIKNSIMVMLQQDKERLSDARKAATSAFATGEKIGGPAGIILGPTFAAMAFAGAMAFEGGGVVPGVGRGDIVPSMLEPGEGVVPGGVMDGLSKMAREGGFNNGGATYHVQVKPTYHVQALDGGGVHAVLDKHTGLLTKHFENSLRKLNR